MSFINYLNCADAKNYFHPFFFSSLSHNVHDCQDLILNITPIFVAALTSSILNQSNRYPCFRVFYKNLNLKLGSVSLNCFWTGQKAILPEPCRGARVWPCSHIFHTISSRSAPEISPALPVFYIALSEILKSHVKLIFLFRSTQDDGIQKEKQRFSALKFLATYQTKLAVPEGWQLNNLTGTNFSVMTCLPNYNSDVTVCVTGAPAVIPNREPWERWPVQQGDPWHAAHPTDNPARESLLLPCRVCAACNWGCNLLSPVNLPKKRFGNKFSLPYMHLNTV